MNTHYPHLFSPLPLGGLTLRNRIMLPPHQVYFTPGYGDGSQRVIDYYVERAKGGAGLVTMSNFVMPRSWWTMGSWGGRLQTSSFGSLTLASDPAMVPVYARLASSLHDQGTAFIAQLNAGGRQGFVTGSRQFGMPLVAPSALPCPRMHTIPKAMDRGDIADLIESVVTGAIHMREAGADGVELFAAQGYLLSEFLSPHTNHRTDEYGGPLENRLRIVVECLQAMRRAVGHDFVVGVRMNGADHMAGGLVIEDAISVAQTLQTTGLVDYFNVSGMTYQSHPGWIADITAPEAMFADHAAQIRAAVPGTPVCVAGRIATPDIAERILETGQADLVGMVRALISDPEWPAKARRGDVADIRQCTYCNQSCLMSLAKGQGVGCVHNTAVGKEGQLGIGTMRPAAHPKKVVVIGGGPAGMAAARVAAERGHRVTLFEKDDTLGGQNRMTARIASRRGYAEVTRWQEHRLRRLGVDLRLGAPADAGAVLAEQPDAVVLATGSLPRRDGYSAFRPDVAAIPGVSQGNVQSVWEAYNRPETFGQSVLVIDEDPHFAGAYTAEYLASQGKQVQIATPHLHVAAELHVNFAGEVYEHLMPLGVKVHPHTLVIGIDGRSVTCKDRYSDRRTVLEGIDTVVLAMGNIAHNPLQAAFEGHVAQLHSIGDCVAPRCIDDAIVDGERVGWMV